MSNKIYAHPTAQVVELAVFDIVRTSETPTEDGWVSDGYSPFKAV